VTARQFDAPVTCTAIRADDVGLFHGANMGSAGFDFHNAALSQSNDQIRPCGGNKPARLELGSGEATGRIESTQCEADRRFAALGIVQNPSGECNAVVSGSSRYSFGGELAGRGVFLGRRRILHQRFQL
jgi:hypothetical protein